MDMNIRLEQPQDYTAVERLTLAAFKTFVFPDGSRPERAEEHYLAHVLRSSPAFVPELDFVGEIVSEAGGKASGKADDETDSEKDSKAISEADAERESKTNSETCGGTDSEIVANIMYTISKVIRPDGAELETLTFGPVSVKPELHGQGLGAEIVRHSLERAREMGYGAVIIVGHPTYYPRFGFRPGSDFGLTMPDGSMIEALMALELIPGYLGEDGGKWRDDEAYDIDKDAFEAWNAQFTA